MADNLQRRQLDIQYIKDVVQQMHTSVQECQICYNEERCPTLPCSHNATCSQCLITDFENNDRGGCVLCAVCRQDVLLIFANQQAAAAEEQEAAAAVVAANGAGEQEGAAAAVAADDPEAEDMAPGAAAGEQEAAAAAGAANVPEAEDMAPVAAAGEQEGAAAAVVDAAAQKRVINRLAYLTTCCFTGHYQGRAVDQFRLRGLWPELLDLRYASYGKRFVVEVATMLEAKQTPRGVPLTPNLLAVLRPWCEEKATELNVDTSRLPELMSHLHQANMLAHDATQKILQGLQAEVRELGLEPEEENDMLVGKTVTLEEQEYVINSAVHLGSMYLLLSKTSLNLYADQMKKHRRGAGLRPSETVKLEGHLVVDKVTASKKLYLPGKVVRIVKACGNVPAEWQGKLGEQCRGGAFKVEFEHAGGAIKAKVPAASLELLEPDGKIVPNVFEATFLPGKIVKILGEFKTEEDELVQGMEGKVASAEEVGATTSVSLTIALSAKGESDIELNQEKFQQSDFTVLNKITPTKKVVRRNKVVARKRRKKN